MYEVDEFLRVMIYINILGLGQGWISMVQSHRCSFFFFLIPIFMCMNLDDFQSDMGNDAGDFFLAE
jgi:hypothetical protein